MGGEEVTWQGPIRTTWARIEPAADAADLSRFTARHALREVHLVVPWTGVRDGTARAAADLRAQGVVVSALGADPRWALDPRPYMEWIKVVRIAGHPGGPAPEVGASGGRGTSGGGAPGEGGSASGGRGTSGGGMSGEGGSASGGQGASGGGVPGDGERDGAETAAPDAGTGEVVFSGVHLDVAPWRLPVWDVDRVRATRGLVELVRRAHELTPDLPLSADLPHWLAAETYWEDPAAPSSAAGPGSVPGVGAVAGVGAGPGRGGGPDSGPGAGAAPGPWTTADAVRTGGAGPAPGADIAGLAPTQGDMGGRLREPPSSRPRLRASTDAPLSARAAAEERPGALPTEPGLPTGWARAGGVSARRRARRSVFEAVLAHLDAVTIMVPRTRAHGQGGILDVSTSARAACAAAGVPYQIGLETRPTTDPRHPRASFHDAGAAALALEAERVAESLESDPLFRGIAVHDWAAWRTLPDRR